MVNSAEGECVVEIALGRRAFANPGGGYPPVMLVSRSHRPANSLGELRAEIASEREEAGIARRIEDRQLTALQPVQLVRIDLAHHVEIGHSRAMRRPC